MRMKALLLQVGEIPPAAGEARNRFLEKRGKQAKREAAKLFRQALAEIDLYMARVALPFSSNPTRRAHLHDMEPRTRAWDGLRVRLLTAAENSDGGLPGERASRAALGHAVHAFRDLRAAQDNEAGHLILHRYGEFVSGLYGCWMEWDPEEGLWYDTCPVVHAHSPYGFSIGFTARRLCSICRLEISSCEHLSIVPYVVMAERYDDQGLEKCSVCHESSCEHHVGSEHEVYQRTLMKDPVIHETSLTPDPREPRTRVDALEMDPQPPPPMSAVTPLRCRRCLLGCGEVSRDPESLSAI